MKHLTDHNNNPHTLTTIQEATQPETKHFIVTVDALEQKLFDLHSFERRGLETRFIAIILQL